MSTEAAKDYNPFDDEQFTSGGGLWDGKVVTITKSVAVQERLTYKDGKPVLNPKGEQSIQTGLKWTGIADGPEEKERSETYSAGDKVNPTPDGKGFVMKDGSPLRFHASCNLAKLSAAAKAAGFPMEKLYVNGAQQLDAFVGARFLMKGEAKLGKDNKPIKDAKGYTKVTYLPVKFEGFATGIAASGAAGGNGAATSAPNGVEAKAVGAVLEALAGGELTRAELIRKLAAKFQAEGDAQGNDVLALVIRDDFHKGKAWKYDGAKASL